MKKLLLTSIAALFLATGTAHAYEWQCGPHYIHDTNAGGEQIIGIITYNRTRENYNENNPKTNDIVVSTTHPGARPSPGIRMKNGKLYYRGKACRELIQ